MLITISDPNLSQVYKIARSIPAGKHGEFCKNKILCQLLSQLVHIDQHAARMILDEVRGSDNRAVISSLLALITLDSRDIEIARSDMAAAESLNNTDRTLFEMQLIRLQFGEAAFRAALDQLFKDNEEQKQFLTDALVEEHLVPDWREPRLTSALLEKRYQMRLERFTQNLDLCERYPYVLVTECGLIASTGFIEEAKRCIAKIKVDINEFMDIFRAGVVQGLIVKSRVSEAQALADQIKDPESKADAIIALFIERMRSTH